MPVLTPSSAVNGGSIIDYASLQTSIANWLHRSDLTALIPDFIALAETMMSGDLDSRQMETRTTLTCVADGTLNARLVALPTDMLEMRRLTVMTSDPVRVLEYKAPDQITADNSWINATGEPDSFTVIGGYIELNATPDSNYSLELVYRQKIPSLTTTSTTNWLLTANPNAYLFGSLLQAMPYIQDDARLPVWQKMYSDAVSTINSVDWYSGSGLRVRSR